MADSLTRPTPRLLDHNGHGRSLPAPYDRARWEQAVLDDGDLHPHAKLLALVLAHHADASGHLPTGGPQHTARLARETGVSPKGTRLSLTGLELEGYLRRPDIHSWKGREVRPISLALPTAAVRQEPPHPGGDAA